MSKILNAALCEASKIGNLPKVKHLIAQGAEIDRNDETPNQQCPIHYAASHKRLAVLEHLILVGASVNLKDALGNDALDYAVASNNVQSVKAVLGATYLPNTKSEKPDVLIRAATNGSIGIVDLLLKNKITQVNNTNATLDTALHMAIGY